MNCIIKLNPTLLGREKVRHIFNEFLGYSDVHVPEEAFENDASWEQAQGFVERLGETAKTLGLGFGVKFNNTLIVENHRDFFPQSEKVMYLSGTPLHVLGIHLVQQFREKFADQFPISFSAGIDKTNFADAVALGLTPITVCSDLLKVGGYSRTFGYYKELNSRMDKFGVNDIESYVLKAYGKAEEALVNIGCGAGNNSGNESAAVSTLRQALENEGEIGKVVRAEAPLVNDIFEKLGGEVVYFGKKHLSRRAKDRKLEKIKAKYKKILRRIAKSRNKSKLKGEELRVYHLVKKNHYKASRRIRGQWGLKDRFKEGIERSGLYMDEIKRILRKYNLPEELSVLPHVESSFQLRAYSSAGAAGIWQFTRSTGRLFMRVGYDVDERRDQILATYGAAKLLKKNYPLDRLKILSGFIKPKIYQSDYPKILT